MLLTHPFLLQVFGVEADAKNLSQNRNISLQYRSQIIHSYIDDNDR
ncbi:hypothetical protein ACLB1M_01195 [Escherichia coli]